MGIAASRELSSEITACTDSGAGFEKLLEDPEFVSRCQSHAGSLPTEAQKGFKEIVWPRKKSQKANNALIRIRTLRKEDLGISEKLEPFYRSWVDPEAFFNQSPWRGDGCVVSQVYQELQHIGQRGIDDPIRLRIYAVALCDLRRSIESAYPLSRLTEATALRTTVKDLMARRICESPETGETVKVVASKVGVYVKLGERMKSIAKQNGGLGALVVLPSQLLTARSWTRGLSGNRFEEALEHLKGIGLADVAQRAGAHTIVSRIHDAILQRINQSEGTVLSPNTIVDRPLPSATVDQPPRDTLTRPGNLHSLVKSEENDKLPMESLAQAAEFAEKAPTQTIRGQKRAATDTIDTTHRQARYASFFPRMSCHSSMIRSILKWRTS
ncbi:MAG: hypothetical protein M4579_005227 [Chaenotheca gracillima]|nr:MAG: hypothetical protein M4579_005227 [Chaenotheca gracillima]